MSGSVVKDSACAAVRALCIVTFISVVSAWGVVQCRGDSSLLVGAQGDRELLMHSDGTYETGYAWRYGGCQAPDYGSFAERYEGCRQVTAIVLDVTDNGYQLLECLDAYVWADDGGVPGDVLAMEPEVCLDGVPWWPYVGRYTVAMAEPPLVDGVWWVGFWGRWPLSDPAFWICADQNGPGGGSPKTKIAPGQQWPEGWQDVPAERGPTAALGIGAEVGDCPTPADGPTWGAIKAMFR